MVLSISAENSSYRAKILGFFYYLSPLLASNYLIFAEIPQMAKQTVENSNLNQNFFSIAKISTDFVTQTQKPIYTAWSWAPSQYSKAVTELEPKPKKKKPYIQTNKKNQLKSTLKS